MRTLRFVVLGLTLGMPGCYYYSAPPGYGYGGYGGYMVGPTYYEPFYQPPVVLNFGWRSGRGHR